MAACENSACATSDRVLEIDEFETTRHRRGNLTFVIERAADWCHVSRCDSDSRANEIVVAKNAVGRIKRDPTRARQKRFGPRVQRSFCVACFGFAFTQIPAGQTCCQTAAAQNFRQQQSDVAAGTFPHPQRLVWRTRRTIFAALVTDAFMNALVQLDQRSHGRSRVFRRRHLPAWNIEYARCPSGPIWFQNGEHVSIISNRQINRVRRDQKVKRILFANFQIQFELELQFGHAIRKSTGGNVVIENITPKTHVCVRVRAEVQRSHTCEMITSRKESHLVDRKADRLIVYICRLIADTHFHLTTYRTPFARSLTFGRKFPCAFRSTRLLAAQF